MTGKHEANTSPDWEKAEIDRANASGLVPVVFRSWVVAAFQQLAAVARPV